MLGLIQQPGGVRAVSGSVNIQYGEDEVKGNGGNEFEKELREGNTITYGDSQHTVKRVEGGSFFLTSPWGGPSSESATIYVSGLLPVIKPGAPGSPEAMKAQADAMAAAAAPFYKKPWFLALVALGVVVGGGLAYRRWRRRRPTGRK